MRTAELSAVTRWGKLPAWWLLHPDVDADRFAVLAALTTYADDEGFCEPSQGTLAKRLGRSRPWANRVVADLASLGLLRKQGRARSNGGTTSCRYQLAQTPEQVEEFAAGNASPEAAVVAATPRRRAADTACHGRDTSHADPEHIRDSRPAARGTGASDDRKAPEARTASPAPDEARGSPPSDWLPGEASVAEALRLCPDADLDEHTARFVARCRSKGYRYASLDDAWLEWLLTDRRAARAVPGGVGHRPARSSRRDEHRFDRFDAWAAAASAPVAVHARC